MSQAKVVPLNPAGSKTANHQATGYASEADGNLFQGLAIEKPPCPKWLSKSARHHWNYITKELENAGLISKLDQGALAILCTSYARMKEAEEQVAEHGEFQTFANGVVQLSPYATSFKRHAAMYFKVAGHYGLTLKARQTIKVENPNQGELDL